MNITFLIGNGFDINLGMETRYTDIYKEYVLSPSKSDNIVKFKEEIDENYENWSDFEMGMARYAENFATEADFVECVRDFKDCLVQGIERQEKLFINRMQGVNGIYGRSKSDDFFNDLANLNESLIPRDTQILNALCRSQIIRYNFITYNYTHSLDYFVENCQDRKSTSSLNIFLPIHVHGMVGSDIVVGVDNIDQFKKLKYIPSRKTTRAFVKPKFNEEYDYRRVERALSIINNSNIICVYGMALGDSDKMWRKQIREWLLSNENNHMIYSYYDDVPHPRHHTDIILELEEERKIEILSKLELTSDEIDKTIKQIHIPIGINIFGSLEGKVKE